MEMETTRKERDGWKMKEIDEGKQGLRRSTAATGRGCDETRQAWRPARPSASLTSPRMSVRRMITRLQRERPWNRTTRLLPTCTPHPVSNVSRVNCTLCRLIDLRCEPASEDRFPPRQTGSKLQRKSSALRRRLMPSLVDAEQLLPSTALPFYLSSSDAVLTARPGVYCCRAHTPIL